MSLLRPDDLWPGGGLYEALRPLARGSELLYHPLFVGRAFAFATQDGALVVRQVPLANLANLSGCDGVCRTDSALYAAGACEVQRAGLPPSGCLHFWGVAASGSTRVLCLRTAVAGTTPFAYDRARDVWVLQRVPPLYPSV